MSNKILQQFARNLGSLLEADRTAVPAAATAPAQRRPRLRGHGNRIPRRRSGRLHRRERTGRSVGPRGPDRGQVRPLAAAFAFGLFEGWLLGRVMTREKHSCADRRNR
ncbi:hypothetical protein NKH18_15455 [Streptomyces sp. M10(2022)]